jgi:hypothetical protein
MGAVFSFLFLFGLCFDRWGLGNGCVRGGSGMETKIVFHNIVQ